MTQNYPDSRTILSDANIYIMHNIVNKDIDYLYDWYIKKMNFHPDKRQVFDKM